MEETVSSNTAGEMLSLVRSGKARTRGDLQQLTGMARSTVSQRLDRLIKAGYLREPGVDGSTGGRPPNRLEFNDQHGIVLAGHLGATQVRLAALDLAGVPLAQDWAQRPVADGPGPMLDWVAGRFEAMLQQAGRSAGDVCGIGLGVPGPVEFDTGRVRQPPMMPGWDDYPIDEHLRARIDAPVLVDNDANLMALGEQVTYHADCSALVLVKVSTGIGAGVIIKGAVYRGIDGGAGDIGHFRLHGHDDTRCLCGSHGCLTAVASGSALATRLSAMGVETESSRDLLARIGSGHPEACRLAREAGRVLGEVLAAVVCLLNPGVVVIAGDLAETNFVTGVREVLYRLALPRATRHLTVTTSRLADRAGIVGAHAMVVDAMYAPDEVDRRLQEVAA